MDFQYLLELAAKNQENAEKKLPDTKKYSTKVPPPKKLDRPVVDPKAIRARIEQKEREKIEKAEQEERDRIEGIKRQAQAEMMRKKERKRSSKKNLSKTSPEKEETTQMAGQKAEKREQKTVKKEKIKSAEQKEKATNHKVFMNKLERDAARQREAERRREQMAHRDDKQERETKLKSSKKAAPVPKKPMSFQELMKFAEQQQKGGGKASSSNKEEEDVEDEDDDVEEDEEEEEEKRRILNKERDRKFDEYVRMGERTGRRRSSSSNNRGQKSSSSFDQQHDTKATNIHHTKDAAGTSGTKAQKKFGGDDRDRTSRENFSKKKTPVKDMARPNGQVRHIESARSGQAQERGDKRPATSSKMPQRNTEKSGTHGKMPSRPIDKPSSSDSRLGKQEPKLASPSPNKQLGKKPGGFISQDRPGSSQKLPTKSGYGPKGRPDELRTKAGPSSRPAQRPGERPRSSVMGPPRNQEPMRKRPAGQSPMRMKVKQGRLLSSDSEESDYDDEDGFIDDSPLEDMECANVSSYIKQIFGYDKSKYGYESDYALKFMDASYKDIQKEEARSSRLGMLEDLEDMRKEKEENKRKAMMKK